MTVNERDAEHLPRPVRYARYALMGARTRRWLDAQPTYPEAIILYSGYTPYLLQFTGWARRRKIPCVFDAVEWYSAANFWKFAVSPYLWNTEFAMRVLIPRLDSIIAISSSLERYYQSRGLRVGRVPPLFDSEEIVPASPTTDRQNTLRLAYCGSPGNKEMLDTVIDAVVTLNNKTRKISLEIAGPSKSDVHNCPSIRTHGVALPDYLRVYGHVSHDRSLKIVGRSDFSVFLRPINRVTTHGFPTKFVESLAVGTPVIANLTSDLADHLRDGETGLVCPAPTRDSLLETLERALLFDDQAYLALRNAARLEAERSFAHIKYADKLLGLIERPSTGAPTQKFIC